MYNFIGYYMLVMIVASLFTCIALPVITKFPHCLFSPEIYLYNWLKENNITTLGKIVFFIITLPIFGFVYIIYFVVIGISFVIVLLITFLINLFLHLFSKKED